MVEEKELGKRIQQQRTDRRLTLQDLAERTGYTKGYLSKIENSEKAPPVSTLINLAKALNISLSEILEKWKKTVPSLWSRKETDVILREMGQYLGMRIRRWRTNFKISIWSLTF